MVTLAYRVLIATDLVGHSFLQNVEILDPSLTFNFLVVGAIVINVSGGDGLSVALLGATETMAKHGLDKEHGPKRLLQCPIFKILTPE